MESFDRPVSVFHLTSSCYLADKDHINRYGIPIFGAEYRAYFYGPVPMEIYDMLAGDTKYLERPENVEISRILASEGYPWRMEGYYVIRKDSVQKIPPYLTDSNRESLRRGFEVARRIERFDRTTPETHDRAWSSAKMGRIGYEVMIDQDNPRREELLRILESRNRTIP